jgi:hypothetical protein
MDEKKSLPVLLTDRIKTSDFVIWLQVESKDLVYLGLTTAAFGLLWAFGIIDSTKFIIAIAPLFVKLCIPSTPFDKYKYRINVMSLSIDFMLNRGKVEIDDILGMLISNKIARDKIIDPTSKFFDAIQS